MRLNVYGRQLTPVSHNCRVADEDKPLCVVVTKSFLDWAMENGIESVAEGLDVGDPTNLEAEIWISAYRDGVAPRILTEHTHERAMYWMSVEVMENWHSD